MAHTHTAKMLPVTAIVIFMALALATLVSEDLACITAGLLVSDGRAGFLLVTLACLVGIFVGDMMLFLIGKFVGKGCVAMGTGALGGFTGTTGKKREVAGPKWSSGDLHIAIHSRDAAANVPGGRITSSGNFAIHAVFSGVGSGVDAAAGWFGSRVICTADALRADGGETLIDETTAGCCGVFGRTSSGIEGGDVARTTRDGWMVLPEGTMGILADVRVLPARISVPVVFRAEIQRIHGFYLVQSGDRGERIRGRIQI